MHRCQNTIPVLVLRFIFCKRVGILRVVANSGIRQRHQEANQIFFLAWGNYKATYQGIFVRVPAAIALHIARSGIAATVFIYGNHLLQALRAAIVQVRRCKGKVAECGHQEPTLIGRSFCKFEQALVARRVIAGTVNII